MSSKTSNTRKSSKTRNTRKTSKTRKTSRLSAAAALAATAATAVAGIALTAPTASAAVVVNKPWKHTLTVETTNVRVFQNNWIRSDVTRTSGYLAQTITHADGNGGYSIRRTPFAENTGGELLVSDSEGFGDGPKPGTAVYDGSISLGAELDLTVDGPNAQFPKDYPDRNYQMFNLAANDTTGWRHITTRTGNGDFIEMDYRVTHRATPQN